ncbi:MAG: TrkH family potassium uptake protein [Desulfuromonas thiophila]|nr:TrkH family potassium uptake protein [Desulfuromonas thiophila]
MHPTSGKQGLGGLMQRLSPAWLLVLYYLLAIVAGALLLTTPWAARAEPLSFLDALFTATSAQCVTGLAVVDTGNALSLFGQLVVLALIQLGGLGLMTFSVYFFLALRLGVGGRGRWIIHETLLHTPVSSWPELVRSVLRLSLTIEAVGTLLLALVLVPQLGWAAGLFSALFHAVSAFCNAGFSLFSDSLTAYRAHPLVNFTIMTLIVLGGIGFLVLREMLDFLRQLPQTRRRPPVLSLHAKVVLLTSAVLIVGGTLLILLLEHANAFASVPSGEACLVALFHSISARTAGFNSIDLAQLRTPTLFLIIFLMFVGASPGSAGGGVKTTSLALFWAIFSNRLRGNRHTSLFRRTLPDELVTRALALVLLALILMALALFALLCVQSPDLQHETTRPFLSSAFEVVSAFATTGLSMGETARLTVAGKLIIIVLMFIGRVGLLTLAFAIAGRERPAGARYAEENIMIG